MKLLIADDSLTSRTMLEHVTRKWGYEPVLAEDGEEAWKILQEPNPPLLMLIDWEMPRLDGLDLCKRIREQDRNLHSFIILLTSRTETENVVAALDAGANDYIVKPFVNEELKARMQAGRRVLQLQMNLKKTQDELSYEKQVIENIILKMRASKPFYQDQLRVLDCSVEKTSGDIMLSALKPDNTRHLLMGDFTGHGVTAAVGGPIVFDVFYTMTAKGISIADIAVEINRQLLEKMPTGLFLGAIFMELNPTGTQLSILNCGMSDVLIFRNFKLTNRVSSSLLALGIIQQDFTESIVIDVEQGDKVYAYSDGITEVINEDNQELGQECFEKLLEDLLRSGKDIDFLIEKVNQFKGRAEQFDDITLMELSC